MEVTGTVHEIGAVNNVTDTFKRREIIIEIVENPSYPEFVKFEAVQDKVSIMDKCKKGDTVNLYFNLKGREWTNKAGETVYFNTLQVWKLEKLTDAKPIPEAAVVDDSDNLPF